MFIDFILSLIMSAIIATCLVVRVPIEVGMPIAFVVIFGLMRLSASAAKDNDDADATSCSGS